MLEAALPEVAVVAATQVEQVPAGPAVVVAVIARLVWSTKTLSEVVMVALEQQSPFWVLAAVVVVLAVASTALLLLQPMAVARVRAALDRLWMVSMAQLIAVAVAVPVMTTEARVLVPLPAVQVESFCAMQTPFLLRQQLAARQ
jgi:hypothetical protein